MPTFMTNCLETTLKNTSGATRNFAFLGNHGRTLEADETITFAGDLFAALPKAGVVRARRLRDSLINAIEQGYLAIVKTPAPLLVDQTTDVTKALRLNNGTLGTEDPCFTISESE